MKQPRRIAQYEIRRELGRGAMGKVYEGHDPGLRRDVALKLLTAGASADAVQRARFAREAQALARLEHPNIVRIHSAGEDDGTPFLVMDLVRGGSLQQRLDKDGPLPVRDAVSIARKVADALGRAHALGIVHRDLKPANILLDDRGEPLLSDFGIAKAMDTTAALSVRGRIIGTLGYCAPEQGRGENDAVGPQADVFGLGATLYALLVGEAPFTGSSVMEVIARLHEPVQPPSRRRAEVDDVLDATILAALAIDPAERLTMAELTRALAAWPRPVAQLVRRPAVKVKPRTGAAPEASAGWLALPPASPALAVLAALAVVGWVAFVLALASGGRAASAAADERAALEAEVARVGAERLRVEARLLEAQRLAATGADRAGTAEARLAIAERELKATQRQLADAVARAGAQRAPATPAPAPAASGGPRDLAAAQRNAQHHIDREEFVQAIPYLDELVLADGAHKADCLAVRAWCHLLLGDKPRAADDARRALAIRPVALAYVTQAFAALAALDLRSALDLSQRALALEPAETHGLTARGTAQLYSADARGALDTATTLSGLVPQDPFALALRGASRAAVGEVAAGLRDTEEAFSRRPDEPKVVALHALALSTTASDLPRAVELLRAPCEQGDVYALLTRAGLLQRRGDLAGAAADLRRLADRVEGVPAARHLAPLLEDVADWAGAHMVASRVGRDDPDALMALVRGRSRLFMGAQQDMDLARRDARRDLGLAIAGGRRHEGHYWLARALCRGRQAETPAALRELDALVELCPNEGGAWFDRAHALRCDLGDGPGAVKALEKALALRLPADLEPLAREHLAALRAGPAGPCATCRDRGPQPRTGHR